MEAPTTSKQGVGNFSDEQTHSLSCRISQIWEDEVQGNGGREPLLIQDGIIPALPDKLSSFLLAADQTFWWFKCYHGP